MNYITPNKAIELIENANGKTVLVIGDVMLDRYFWGSVSRVSPEAPVPVIDIEDESFHLGGAANVAKNLRSLGAIPILCGVIGDDNSGRKFLEISQKIGLNTDGLYIDKSRPTTVKTRILGNNQHIARIDREVRGFLPEDGIDFINKIVESKKNLAAIIFEDYDKGTISEKLIRNISEYAKKRNIPIFVDPKKHNFYHYKDVTVFKPNRKEAQQALDYQITTKEDVIKAGSTLLDKLNCDNVLLTLGAQGMMLFEKNGNVSSVPTRARSVADVSGAGDTAIATLVVGMIGGGSVQDAATMANYASGVVCEKPGIVAIEVKDLIASIKYNNVK